MSKRTSASASVVGASNVRTIVSRMVSAYNAFADGRDENLGKYAEVAIAGAVAEKALVPQVAQMFVDKMQNKLRATTPKARKNRASEFSTAILAEKRTVGSVRRVIVGIADAIGGMPSDKFINYALAMVKRGASVQEAIKTGASKARGDKKKTGKRGKQAVSTIAARIASLAKGLPKDSRAKVLAAVTPLLKKVEVKKPAKK